MRRPLLVVLILVAQSVLAQEPPPAQNPPEPARPAPAQTQAAPKPGHPLDPADVDVLSGKNKALSSGAYGYAASPSLYWSYPLGRGAYSSTRPFGNRSFSSLPGLPLLRRGFGARSFFLFDTRRLFSPSLFFFNGGRSGPSFFFSAPVRSRFSFHR
jgi:hypothetical protein